MSIYNIEKMNDLELKEHIKKQKDKLEFVIADKEAWNEGIFDQGSIDRISQSIVDAEKELEFRNKK